jgi:hypothetical protein
MSLLYTSIAVTALAIRVTTAHRAQYDLGHTLVCQPVLCQGIAPEPALSATYC